MSSFATVILAACAPTPSDPPPVMVPPQEMGTQAAATQPPSPPPAPSESTPVHATLDAEPTATEAPAEASPAKSSSCAGNFRSKEEVVRRCHCTGELCALDPTDAAAVRAQLEIKLTGPTNVASKKILALDVLVKNKDTTKPVAFGLMQDRHVGWTVKDGNGASVSTMEPDCDPQWTRQLDKKRKGPPGFTLVYLGPGATRRFVTEVATDVYRPVPTSPPKPPACIVGVPVASLFGPATERGSLLMPGRRYTVDVSLPFADAGTRGATKGTTGFEVK